MNICKRKSFICLIVTIIITISVPITALANDITWCPGCGRYSLDITYIDPTCINEGIIYYECGYCSYYDEEYIPPSSDYHRPNIFNATCTEDKRCIYCGYLYESKLGQRLCNNIL